MRPIDDLQSLERLLLAERLGIGVDAAAAFIDRTVHEGWESLLDRVKPYLGVRECVARLHAAGLRTGVISDFPVGRKLGRLGLEGLFECAQWSEESGYLKPNPEPFLRIADCLGSTPETTVYVGNSYEYDVVGAKSVGMVAVHLARRRVAGGVADFTTRSYRDLGDWILSQTI